MTAAARIAVEVLSVVDRGRVSTSQWATDFVVRTYGEESTRRITSLQDIEDLTIMMPFLTFDQARHVRDTVAIQGASLHHAFTRDRGVLEYINVPYVEPGAPLPPETILYSKFCYGSDDDED